MKISLIFGLLHMVFGLSLSLWNKRIRGAYTDILLEFVPQLIFLLFIFCYLLFMIFFKVRNVLLVIKSRFRIPNLFQWTHYYADTLHKDSNVWSEHCAPNLLITFINMMLFKSDTPDPALYAICEGKETYMFTGQHQLQAFLVVAGVLMVPVMLFGKPLQIWWGKRHATDLWTAASLSCYVPLCSHLKKIIGGHRSSHPTPALRADGRRPPRRRRNRAWTQSPRSPKWTRSRTWTWTRPWPRRRRTGLRRNYDLSGN